MVHPLINAKYSSQEAGTAGAIASLASRNTLFLEAGTSAGGIATSGWIHSYCVGLPGGLQDEVDKRVTELAPLFGPPDRAVGFHPEAKKTAMDIMLREAMADVRYGAMIVGTISKQVEGIIPSLIGSEPVRRLQEAVTASAEGSAIYSADVFIDSSGDANLAA